MEKRNYILEINMEVEYSQESGLNEECDLVSVNVQNELKTLASLAALLFLAVLVFVAISGLLVTLRQVAALETLF